MRRNLCVTRKKFSCLSLAMLCQAGHSLRVGLLCSDKGTEILDTSPVIREVLSNLVIKAPDTFEVEVVDVPLLGLRSSHLAKVDVLLIPGGQPNALFTRLTSSGAKAIQKAVAEGMGYVGICAGAALATNKKFLNLVPTLVTMNDNLWANSGFIGDVEVKFLCEPLLIDQTLEEKSKDDKFPVPGASINSVLNTPVEPDQEETPELDSKAALPETNNVEDLTSAVSEGKSAVLTGGEAISECSVQVDNEPQPEPTIYEIKGIPFVTQQTPIREMCYENGPVYKLKPNSKKVELENTSVIAEYFGDMVEIRENQVRLLEEEITNSKDPTRWVCKGCTAVNEDMLPGNVKKKNECDFCEDSRQKKLPPRGEMPGKIAICSYRTQPKPHGNSSDGGKVALFSNHPESTPMFLELLIEAIFWASNKAP